jgi:poly(beta-D-mannuronate) lyase
MTSNVYAASHLVSSVSQFNAIAPNLQPGDEVVIQNGTYNGTFVNAVVAASGSADKPIVIRPQTPYGVTLSGTSGSRFFVLSGNHITLQGFDFKSAISSHSSVVDIAGSHVRITGNRFLDSGNAVADARMIQVQSIASHVQIDHNYFRGSRSMSIGTVNSDTQGAQHTYIHHNVFRDFTRLTSNGQEPIQIGNGPSPRHAIAQYTLVEYNLFDNTNADTEIISNKSSYNTIRRNVMANSPDSELTIRGGTHVTVDGNVMVNNARGLVVFGTDHVVTNNIIQGATAWGIEISQGDDFEIPNGSNGGDDFQIAKRSLIAHNTLIDTGSRGIYYRAVALRGPAMPSDNTVINNLVVMTGTFGGNPRIAIDDLTQAATDNVIGPNLVQVSDGAIAGAGTQLLGLAALTGTGPTLALTAGSGAIGAAVTSGVAFDAFGNPRPLTAGADMGHHQFGGIVGFDEALYVPPDRSGFRQLPLAAALRTMKLVQVVGVPILFDAVFSTGNIRDFEFDFGDGQTLLTKELVAAHVWTEPGEYLVTLTVYGPGNQRSTVAMPIHIVGIPEPTTGLLLAIGAFGFICRRSAWS